MFKTILIKIDTFITEQHGRSLFTFAACCSEFGLQVAKMKRFLLCFIIIFTVLAGCTEQAPTETEAIGEKEFSNGLWISHNEIAAMLKSENGLQQEFSTILQKAQKLHINQIYIHVRSHCDSIFESSYFPLTDSAKQTNYDIFEYMLKLCHQNNIKVHAWINPYRVSATPKEPDSLPSDSPALRWLTDDNEQNDRNVIFYNGIYLNPCEFEVRELVIAGVKEILQKYSVDGIHFDDYFYPTTDEEFDRESYESYTKTAKNPLSLADWRRANVDALISGCKTAIELSGKDVIFSISPAAAIEKNYNTLYADIGGWTQKGYLDEIIPQLYFGFDYKDENFQFTNLISEWKKLCEKNTAVKLTVGLAPYKIGTASEADGSEWQENSDILLRQLKICFCDPQIAGVVYFSSTSLFSENTKNIAERVNLENFISSNFEKRNLE